MLPKNSSVPRTSENPFAPAGTIEQNIIVCSIMNYTPVVIEHQHKVLQVADEKANALSNPHILLFLS